MELGAHLLHTLGEESQEILAVLEGIRGDRYRSIRG
jgi:hypothetical protein